MQGGSPLNIWAFLLSANGAIVADNDGMRLLLRVPISSSSSHMFVSVGVPTALLFYAI